MAYAAFKLLKCTGSAAGTETDCSKAPNFLSADLQTSTPASYAVVIPGTGSARSYEVWLRLECTTAPDNYCENFDIWGPSTQPDDPTNKLTVYMGANTTGVTPIVTASTIASSIQHSTYYEAGTALAFDIVNETITAVGNKTQYIVLQLKVDTGATSGAISGITFSLSWDEA